MLKNVYTSRFVPVCHSGYTRCTSRKCLNLFFIFDAVWTKVKMCAQIDDGLLGEFFSKRILTLYCTAYDEITFFFKDTKA